MGQGRATGRGLCLSDRRCAREEARSGGGPSIHGRTFREHDTGGPSPGIGLCRGSASHVCAAQVLDSHRSEGSTKRKLPMGGSGRRTPFAYASVLWIRIAQAERNSGDSG